MLFQKETPPTLWIGLSFLAVGLMAGLLLTGGGNLFISGVGGGGSEASKEAEEIPDIDPESLETVAVSNDDDAVLGDPNAPVTMIEFSDFQCPYCQKFFLKSLPLIKENYIDTGKVKLIYRDFPIPSHTEADEAAEAAECVARGEGGAKDSTLYFQMHDLIFERMSEWSGKENAAEVLISMASELDVDIRTCLENRDMREEVSLDYTAGRSYGITGTPSFFINGKKLTGAWPYEVFVQVIDSQL